MTTGVLWLACRRSLIPGRPATAAPGGAHGVPACCGHLRAARASGFRRRSFGGARRVLRFATRGLSRHMVHRSPFASSGNRCRCARDRPSERQQRKRFCRETFVIVVSEAACDEASETDDKLSTCRQSVYSMLCVEHQTRRGHVAHADENQFPAGGAVFVERSYLYGPPSER